MITKNKIKINIQFDNYFFATEVRIINAAGVQVFFGHICITRYTKYLRTTILANHK